jgi:pSer/pThr/pTyr-binding forkhead associated (FHA) protein
VAYWLSVRGSAPFELKDGVDVTIGRGQSCDLALYSSMLSREHARVRWENGRPVLFDLESLNGTFVGLDRVARHTLKEGDVIRFGDINVLFTVSDTPPEVQDDQLLPQDDEATAPADLEPSNETRLYSRTAVLHQKVFEYDELAWLQARLGERAQLLGPASAGRDDLAAWFDELGRDAELLWEFLRLGVIRPIEPRVGLRGLSPPQVAQACVLTKRAEKLRTQLGGQRAIWNEMAALRYQVRQGKAFKALRFVARAYRPGGGLERLTVARMVEELRDIYAPELAGPPLDAELRRLQALGFVAPIDGAKGEAWYPIDWADGSVELTSRGRAMLEGFRLED